MSDQLPGEPPGQAQGHDPRGNPPDWSRSGLPSESIGAPRPPRQYRKGLRNSLPVAIGLALVVVYIFVSPARTLLAVVYAVYLIVTGVTVMVRRGRRAWRRRSRRDRLRPPSGEGETFAEPD